MLPGQGKRLPDHFPYEGEWLIENQIFLYRSADTQIFADAVRLTASSSSGDGQAYFGLDVSQLAIGFRMSSDMVLEHNRARELYLITVKDVPASHAFAQARLYVLQIGDRQIGITVERSRIGGHA